MNSVFVLFLSLSHFTTLVLVFARIFSQINYLASNPCLRHCFKTSIHLAQREFLQHFLCKPFPYLPHLLLSSVTLYSPHCFFQHLPTSEHGHLSCSSCVMMLLTCPFLNVSSLSQSSPPPPLTHTYMSYFPS